MIKKRKICYNCNEEFYIKASRLKEGSRGKFCSRNCANEYRKGWGHPMYGKKHKKETIEKFRLITKERHQERDNFGFQKGNQITKGNKWNVGENHPLFGKRRSKNYIEKVSGKNNCNWNGGTSKAYKTGYWKKEYKDWRKKVFERDSYTCQKCGLHGSRGYLTAHHIKSFSYYPKLRFDVNNGLTLCEECHKLTDNYKGRNNKKKINQVSLIY